jgi:hypothetical protein
MADKKDLYSDRGAKPVGENINETKCKYLKEIVQRFERIKNTCPGAGL